MSLFVCFYCLIGWVGGFTRIVAEGHGLSECFFTRSVAESHGFFFLSRIVGFFFSSHGVSRKVTGSCHELSNCRINTFNHTENRGRSRNFSFFHELSNYRILSITRRIAEGHGFLSRDLSFGPTDQREVIFELSNCFFTCKIMCISWVSQTSVRR